MDLASDTNLLMRAEILKQLHDGPLGGRIGEDKQVTRPILLARSPEGCTNVV